MGLDHPSGNASWPAAMHRFLFAAAKRRAWGERLGDPEELCEAFLPWYRLALKGPARDDGLRRAAAEALDGYVEAEWAGERAEYCEELAKGFEQAITALAAPEPLLDALFEACGEAIAVRRGLEWLPDQSVWLPSRTNVARACVSTIESLNGAVAVADAVFDAFTVAFRWTDEPEVVFAALYRSFLAVVGDDDSQLCPVGYALERTDPTAPTFHVLFTGFRDRMEAGSVTTATLTNALVEVIEVDYHQPQEASLSVLLDASENAIRTADDPAAAMQRMIHTLRVYMPKGPATPPPGMDDRTIRSWRIVNPSWHLQK